MTTQIPISADLQSLMGLPDCSLLSLPKPSKLSINLPNGAVLPALTDISKGVPTDCSLAFSLMLQLAPFLASIECLLKVLKLLQPLIEIITGLTHLPLPKIPGPDVLAKFAEAAVDVTLCITDMVIPGLGMLSFIKSVIILILSFLKCFVGGLSSIVNTLASISIQMGQADADGNDELKRVLQCAADNTMTSADHLQGAMGPVFNILDLVQPILALAQIKIEIPSIAPGADLDGLKKALAALQDVVTILEAIITAPPLDVVPPKYPDTGS